MTYKKRHSQQEEIAQKESKQSVWLRVLAVLVLVLLAVAVVVGVCVYMTDEEQQEFETTFDADASKVVEAIGKTLDQTLGSTDAFIVQMVANARDNVREWPFVTMLSFGLQASKLPKNSMAFQVAIGHFVEPAQQLDWQNYTMKHNDWIDESLDVMEQDPDWKGDIVRNYKVVDEIHGYVNPGVTSEIGPIVNPTAYRSNYLARRQQHPTVPPKPDDQQNIPYNWDTWQMPPVAAAISHPVEHQQVVVAPVGNIISNSSDRYQVIMAGASQRWATPFIPPGDDASEPISMIVYPIYDAVETVRFDGSQAQSPVGVLNFGLFWRELIRDVVTTGALTVVFTDTCGPPLTYALSGPTAIYLGPDDVHNAKFNYLGQSFPLNDSMTSIRESDRGSTYTGVPVSDDYCPRTIHLYPSQELQDQYATTQPAIFALVVASIFLFTSLVFLAYDRLVARRQRIVKHRDLASGAIVSSLFPNQVRQQLYNNLQGEIDGSRRGFVKSGNLRNSSSGEAVVQMSRPNASLYENTTIFFADLAGFTAWPSKRTPQCLEMTVEIMFLLISFQNGTNIDSRYYASVYNDGHKDKHSRRTKPYYTNIHQHQ